MKWFNLEDNINLLSIIGAIAIIILTVFVVGLYMKQMKEKRPDSELSSDEWDGIGEYLNPLPLGWAVTFFALIVWTIWYFLVGYPLNSYSQIGEYNEETSIANDKFKTKFANADEKTLHAMGEGIFLVQCSPCHGILGNGMDSKAMDLSIWGSEEGIVHSLMKGSKGLNYPLGEMPADLVSEADAKAAAAYVVKEISSIKSTSASPDIIAQGKTVFETNCATCHGIDGKGMEGSSPDLSKYGSSEFVIDVLQRGKKGIIGNMPAFTDGRLNEVQKKAVSEYILSLSK
ncbi:c-type cytochrome [Campylobacter sp. RM12327]|uniref:c-type cytochrome n=1 Tax=Campylobacter sputorum TaxID=206 RepID=UPI000B78A2D0|nr:MULTISPECIES: c-type cytochrome [Campylobacter]ASM39378.1 cytochrome c oxidase CcoNOPQ, cbb3-type, membrane-bound monoheme cytochrome c subunit III [Campylobacter sputorum]MBE7358288.1 c-type cytochrome [Campylobacter sp. RM11302]MBF6669580.1 c-type cytochrome [Campylobacter sp. RM12327]MBF6674289.1 c-type cytochrome [Campylobacter sp. RM13538]MBF6676073.1 c-type cytochrome [Campylobacter sp. RM12321]